MEGNKIIILGSDGHIGRIITKSLANKYEVLAPSSSEVNILNKKELVEFARKHKNSTCINLSYRHHKEDTPYQIYDYNVKMTDNIRIASGYFNRLIHLGSIVENITINDDSCLSGTSLMDSIYRETKLYAFKKLSSLTNCSYLKIAPCFGADFFIDKFIQQIIAKPQKNNLNNTKNHFHSHYLYIYDLANILDALIQSSDTLTCNLCNNDFISRDAIIDFIINYIPVNHHENLSPNSNYVNDYSLTSEYIKNYKYISILSYIKCLLNSYSVSKCE